jgi:lycopene beta-cyclase
MDAYDFIIAGGGAAGLSLAYHLSFSPLKERSILIVDKDAKNQNDHTWCFWIEGPLLFDEIVCRTWNQIKFTGDDFDKIIDLETYQYRMIRGVDFYRFTHTALQARPNVEFLQGSVEQVEDADGEARVTVNGQVYRAGWVFDSLFAPGEFKPDTTRYHYLKQHFKGWEIETSQPVFNPQAASWFDFRTPQFNSMRFIYILPFSENRALVEYTLFSADLLTSREYELGLKNYLTGVLKLADYRILEEENGIIPMTDQPFPRRAGQRIMNIGTKGGRVKPSTGYAFMRIQRDSAAIVQSLLQNGHPFDVPPTRPRYNLFDTAMLQVMFRQGDLMKPIFTRLFQRNPIRRIFRFLDETGSWSENIQLLATLPPAPFVKALYNVSLRRKL